MCGQLFEFFSRHIEGQLNYEQFILWFALDFLIKSNKYKSLYKIYTI